MTFNELNIADPILRAIGEKGYIEPTPIQTEAIPVILQKKDIFGIAQTGTGKTAAFAIPILQSLLEEKETASQKTESGEEVNKPKRSDRRGRNHDKNKAITKIKALVITSTRELALQISEDFSDYGKFTGLRHTAIFGGVKKGAQTEKLKHGIDILIATPGRLLDLINQGFVNLGSIKHLVLDEADRMLDMGFITDVRRILKYIPEDRQTLLFSATLPKDIVYLSNSILKNPAKIEVTPVSSTVDVIDQCIYFVEKPDKKQLLISLIKKEADKTMLVFSRTKHGADYITRALKKAGIQSESIHGDKSQVQRQKALSNFKTGKTRIMVATDIAARGIDIKELNIVINYDLPDVAETYVHRIGRTGRAGHSGTALTFCTQEEHMKVKEIQELTGKKIETILHTA
ncbi:MAG: DEAD/DEAH box helicase [Rikenellaceae bacterium]|nr:DEAD/DEAH box helicase [Rikenellaceae bacterium]